MDGMSRQEQKKLVNQYIGVNAGYLGDFSYRTHSDFYPEFCDLDLDPNTYSPGTTRERFENILSSSDPEIQAKIIRGILKKYPPADDHPLRKQELHDELLRLAHRLECGSLVENPNPAITSAIVEHTLADAETLIRTRGATSSVDRIHTALHGYMRAVCTKAGVAYPKDAQILVMFKALREKHPAFTKLTPRSQDITVIMRSISAIMDVLNPIRNLASPAHPNDDLLEAPEAMLVVNATRTILHYIDAKLAADELS